MSAPSGVELPDMDEARVSTITCAQCGGLDGAHGLVHVRYGNGGGGNRPCPKAWDTAASPPLSAPTAAAPPTSTPPAKPCSI